MDSINCPRGQEAVVCRGLVTTPTDTVKQNGEVSYSNKLLEGVDNHYTKVLAFMRLMRPLNGLLLFRSNN